jgi:hypothetical protein
MAFKLQKSTDFYGFKLEKCIPNFGVFMDSLKTIVLGFVGMQERCRFFQVIVGSIGMGFLT